MDQLQAAKSKRHVTLTLPVDMCNRLLDLASAEERTLPGHIRWVLSGYLRALDAKQEEHSAGDDL